ncbi:tripartite motif-containing protein 44 [Engraulis encrasicolus]|uniref:tripartite motif-containing protein 44 n=1 Tax=Engraulis encrasicolus TaxID=184585 RepID=UPI002FD7495F
MAERNACWDAKDQEMAAGGEEGDLDEPEMDGTCDACEPDEPQPATHVCPVCRFAFCAPHADKHALSTRHQMIPYYPEGSAGTTQRVRATTENHHGGPPTRDTAACSAAAGAGSGPPGSSCSGGAAADTGQEEMEVVEQDQGGQSGTGAHKGCLNGGMGPEEERAGDDDGDGGDAGGATGGAEPDQSEAGGSAGRKETVSVERLRCREHNQEGSLYCKLDEKIICVVCAVQGEHRQHEIITLREAYLWQKSREGIDLVSRTQEMAEKIQNRWTAPDMDKDELERYVNQQFDELHRLVRLEERRTLHLVDLKEAFLTAQAGEMIAEINVNTERLQEEVDSITQQLGELEKISPSAPAPPAAAAAAAASGPVEELLGGGDDAGAGALGPVLAGLGGHGALAGPHEGQAAAAGAGAGGVDGGAAGVNAPGRLGVAVGGGPGGLVAAVAEVEAAVAALAAPARVNPFLAQGPRPPHGPDARPRMPEHRRDPVERRGFRDSDSDRGGYAP